VTVERDIPGRLSWDVTTGIMECAWHESGFPERSVDRGRTWSLPGRGRQRVCIAGDYFESAVAACVDTSVVMEPPKTNRPVALPLNFRRASFVVEDRESGLVNSSGPP
jgi:hypothetical protein